ncbi:transforming growth factor-beta-induced protein ig-h3-like [Plakobranchus ocellatus]|uniref:Transforming growth factor-beta-induced protein ig-h3-like n=1 Tax=Plakobranchus ocellatus TaxID=259542 RepID=A0AAV4CIL0_9GAST|nr:transforming growth factor-beta-induced protein ig-h3-like [Plakobranchus ocellatus]
MSSNSLQLSTPVQRYKDPIALQAHRPLLLQIKERRSLSFSALWIFVFGINLVTSATMQLLPACLLLALVAGFSSARHAPQETHAYLDVNIDNVKKMILEYRPEEELEKSEDMMSDLAARMWHETIKHAESEPVTLDPIPGVATSLGLTELVKAVVAAGLAETLSGPGPFTVFGPSNEAFNNLPDWEKKAIKDVKVLADILKFHVLAGKVMSSDLSNDLVATTVEGKKLRVNLYKKKAGLVATAQCSPIDLNKVDNAASNGVIHVLNRVMFPPSGTIVEAVSKCPAFKTLTKAVQVAGLVDTLNGEGPFTLFAPTDKAFAKLPPGALDKLIANPTELAKVLTYHVVAGTLCSPGLESSTAKTVEGQDVKVVVSGAGVTVNNAKVIAPDASVTNGVVHGIDTVLLPPTFELP